MAYWEQDTVLPLVLAIMMNLKKIPLGVHGTRRERRCSMKVTGGLIGCSTG